VASPLLQILSASWEGGTIDLHTFDESTSSWTLSTLVSNAPGAHSVVVADLDGDGDTDIVAAAAAEILWLENGGDGAVWTRRVVSNVVANALDVGVADVDGDSDVDVVSADFGSGVIYFHSNTGGGATFDTSTISTLVVGAYSVDFADINKDGMLDVFSCGWNGGGVYVHTQAKDNAGNVAWITTEVAEEAADGANSVWADDINNDGAVDVVIALSPGTVEWFESPNPAAY